MRQNLKKLKIFAVLFTVLLPAWAGTADLSAQRPLKKRKPVRFNLPDLVVTDIRLIKGCQIKVTLKKPGGTTSYTWFPNAANLKLTPGVHSIKVIADHGKVMPEANERNNSLTRRLKCGKKAIPNPSVSLNNRLNNRLYIALANL
jgi:hypothetical protein